MCHNFNLLIMISFVVCLPHSAFSSQCFCRWGGCDRWNSDDQRSFQRLGLDQSSTGFVTFKLKQGFPSHTRTVWFISGLRLLPLCLRRAVCWGDPCVRRSRSCGLHQGADVHHRRGGGGETDSLGLEVRLRQLFFLPPASSLRRSTPTNA